MNRIYLFGKVVSRSKLKYLIGPKLSICIELSVETVSGSIFNCIVGEKLLDSLVNIQVKDYVYINGFGVVQKDLLSVIVREIYVVI